MFGAVAIFSLGVFVLPFAAAFLLWLVWHSPHLESLGFLSGAGLVLMGVGIAHLRDIPCSSLAAVRSCSGFDSEPWLVAGGSAFSLGIAAYIFYVFYRHRHGVKPVTSAGHQV